MGAVADAIGDAISDTIDAVVDFVELVWYEVVVPLLEDIFALLGITDETVVTVQKTSIMIFGDNTEDVLRAANIKAVMDLVTNGGSYFPYWYKYTRATYANVKNYYQYGEKERYIHGLPSMSIQGSDIDYTALDTALDDHLGFAATRLSSQSIFPSDDVYFKDKIQATPYFYIPWNNTLTFTDPYGVSWDDYTLGSIIYNSGTDDFTINVSRTAAVALFWLEGPVHLQEGETATYTIKCNRTVPVGDTIDFTLTYAGTAVDPGDYTKVLTATMLASTNEITFDVVTDENTASDGSRTIIVTLATVTNNLAAFEHVSIHTRDEVTTTITDDEGIILTMPSVLVTEASGSAVVPVTLEEAAAGAFTVDYALTNGTALGGGIDYDSTAGTLNFAGTAGEVQDITIPITSADGDDDNEYFTVSFTSCSDPLVGITQTATVTITDDSSDPIAGDTNLPGSFTENGYIKERSMIVTYHANSDPATEWFYWVYKYSDATYPDVAPTMSIISNMDMLPIGILRHNKQSINVNKETEEYKTTKRLIQFIDLDIDDIIDNIEASPSITDVDDVFINFAVSPSSEHELVSKILWLQWVNVIVTHAITSNSESYSAIFEEQDVQNGLAWNFHESVTGISGTLASGQEYEHEIIARAKITEDLEADPPIEGQEKGSSLWIRHQTAAGLYDTLEIRDMSGMAAIEYNGYHKMAINSVEDVDFTIPLSHYTLSQMTPIEQLILYQYIIRLDIYSINITELEWYQTSAFGTLFFFAGIVITIWTLGTATSFWVAAMQILSQYVIMELVIFIAEQTGNAALAAVVGLVAMVAIGGPGGFQFDFATAEGLISLSTEFANNITLAYGVEQEQLVEDMNELNTTAEKRLKEIKDKEIEENPIDIDFMMSIKSVDTQVYPAIKAQYDFDMLYNYDRIIRNYHDIQLQTGAV